MTYPPELLQDLEVCRRIEQRHGKSYYLATTLFPRDMRLATFALYAFFRVPDDLVDEPKDDDPSKGREALIAWREAWRRAMAGERGQDPVVRAAVWVFKTYRLPQALGEDFLSAMEADTHVHRYADYGALEGYMYGSAAVVGILMCHVMGGWREAFAPYTRSMGEAMQLANFLRDIKDDLETRGRVYLPQDELARFGLDDADLRARTVDDRFKAFMRFQVARADALFEEADKGVPLLPRPARFAVRTASMLYRAILRKIEAQGYDVYARRARTNGLEKLWMTCKAFVTTI